MTTQTMISDAERVAIEKEALAILNRWNVSANLADTSDWHTFLSDAYNLGSIGSAEIVATSKDLIENYREEFKRLERQEDLEDPKTNLAVLSPEVVVGTTLLKGAAYYKDGTVERAAYAFTFVFLKIEGDWKIIHTHSSSKPIE